MESFRVPPIRDGCNRIVETFAPRDFGDSDMPHDPSVANISGHFAFPDVIIPCTSGYIRSRNTKYRTPTHLCLHQLHRS